MPVFGSVDTQTDLTGGGTLIINGARPPTDTDGVVGDYWLDTAGKTLYGPKGASGYGATESAHPNGTLDSSSGNFTTGVKFRCLVAGQLMGLRYYRAAGITLTSHKLTLFDTAGAVQNTASTSAETGQGWMLATFATPRAVTANSDWVAGWYSGNSGYNYWASGLVPVSTVPAHISFLENRLGGGDAFPGSHTSDFFVDVLFQPTLPAWPIAIKSAP